MYHALLTNRYLTSRVIPFIAVAAVALCVALVIVVVSVMTGFLDMVKSSGKTLMGDVVISYPVAGIPHYERLMERIRKLPEAAAATPVVDGLGLLKMPYPEGAQKRTEMVQFWGIEPGGFAEVTGYAKTLYWTTVSDDQWRRLFSDVVIKYWKDLLPSLSDDQKLNLVKQADMLEHPKSASLIDEQKLREAIPTLPEDFWRNVFGSLRHDSEVLRGIFNEQQWHDLLAHDERLLDRSAILKEGLSLKHGGSNQTIVLGMHVSEGNERQKDGTYQPMAMGFWWMPRFEVTLTTLPVSEGISGSENAESSILQVVNEFVSGVYLIDDKRVMIPIEIAQSMLHLHQGEHVDPKDPTRTLGIQPARATMVLVRARVGHTPEQLRDAVVSAYKDFANELAQDSSVGDWAQPPALGFGLTVQTWAQQQAQFIGPVEKERELMRTIFSIVYIVCAALVLSIFWAIVYEKTRDIGILRSVGASRSGIVWVFLRYGLIVGLIGALVGLGLGALVTHYINTIHSALAQPPLALGIGVLVLAGVAIAGTIVMSLRGALLPLVVGSLVSFVLIGLGVGTLLLRYYGGMVIWDPSVYYFTKIPNQIDMTTAITTMIGAVLFSLVGAAVPAAKAADTDPVQALRYE